MDAYLRITITDIGLDNKFTADSLTMTVSQNDDDFEWSDYLVYTEVVDGDKNLKEMLFFYKYDIFDVSNSICLPDPDEDVDFAVSFIDSDGNTNTLEFSEAGHLVVASEDFLAAAEKCIVDPTITRPIANEGDVFVTEQNNVFFQGLGVPGIIIHVTVNDIDVENVPGVTVSPPLFVLPNGDWLVGSIIADSLDGTVNTFGFRFGDSVSGELLTLKVKLNKVVSVVDPALLPVIISQESGTTSLTKIPMGVTFDVPVDGFDVNDLFSVNSLISDFIILSAGTVYQFALTPSDTSSDSTLSVYINENVVTSGGNFNPASETFSINYVPASVADPALLPVITSSESGTTSLTKIPMTVTFTTPVEDFTIYDLFTTNADISDFKTVTPGILYTFTLSPSIDDFHSYTLSVTIKAGKVTSGESFNPASETFSINYVPADPDSGSSDPPKKKKGGGSKDWAVKPTFGKTHNSHRQIIDNGFTFNDYSLTITDNWHTDFVKTSSIIGDSNTEIKSIYC